MVRILADFLLEMLDIVAVRSPYVICIDHSFKLFIYNIIDRGEVRKLKRVRPHTHVFLSPLRSNGYRTSNLMRTKIFPVSVRKAVANIEIKNYILL